MEDQKNRTTFLKVKYRNTVLVGEIEICKMLSFVGGTRNPQAHTIIQVANVDTGEIKLVHSAEVKKIVCTEEQQVQQRQL